MTDRNETPGIRLVPGKAIPPFITEHHVEACVVHSRSKGWIPAVSVLLEASDGTGFTFTMRADDVVEFVEILLDAVERSDVDITAAVIDGLKPPLELT